MQMTKYAVIVAGGKQYLVKENDEIVVDRQQAEEGGSLKLDKLAEFETEKLSVELGAPLLKEKVTAKVIAQLKGDKIRIAKFKAKVRYRKVKGFRAKLTKLKITKI